MRRILFFVFLTAFISGTAFAGEFGMLAGYSGFAMNDVNSALSDTAGPSGGVIKVHDGSLFGLDILFDAGSRLEIGPRLEFLNPNRGQAAQPISFPNSVFFRQDVSLVPVMIGLKYMFADLGNGVELNGKVFTGFGFGESVVRNYTVGIENAYDGVGWVGEPMIGMDFRASYYTDIGFEMGYRFADMGTMGGPVRVDFSGAFFNVTLNYRFKYSNDYY